MSINSLLQKYSVAFFIGFLLFLSSTIFSFTSNLQLQERIAEAENHEISNRIKIRHLEMQLALQRKYLGKKFVKFKTIDYTSKIFSSDTLTKYQYSLMLFVIGGCSSCFEQEAHLWNVLINKLKSKDLFGAGVNISLDDNLIIQYLRDRTINYPLFHNNEVFSRFLNEFQNFEVLAFLVNSDLRIEKVHASLPKEPELTAAFTEEILNHLEVAQP